MPIFSGAGTEGIVADPVTEAGLFLRDDGSWAAAAGPQGPKGDQGDQGPIGPIGPEGPPGEDGIIASVVGGTNITVDSTDPANPIVNWDAATLSDLSDTDLTTNPLLEGQGLWYDADTGLWKNRSVLAEAFPTGLIDGGELNIGPGVNDIEVIAGFGLLTDSYTDPLAPAVAVGIAWPQINTAITAAPAVAGNAVWFSLAATATPSVPAEVGGIPVFVATLNQYAQPPSPALARAELFLGLAVHNGDEWSEISSPKVVNQAAETLRELATAVLPFSSIVSGGTTRETGTFEVEQDEGVVWENNRNWHVNKADPNRETLPAQSPVTFKYVTRDFSSVGVATTTFDPDTYDQGGSPVGVPGGNNTTTIQKLYVDPANNYWVLYGQESYRNFFTAEANLTADLARSEIPSILQNSILLGYAVMEKGKNNWDQDEAVWIPAGGANGTGGGGGTPITDHKNLTSIGINTHDQIDTHIASTANPHAVTYAQLGGTAPEFAGAGTTGFVPDPVTEDGKFLLDDGTWTNTIDGGTF